MKPGQINEWADKIGLETVQARRALPHVVHNLQVFDKKQKDYGPKTYNVTDAAGNPCPELAVASRANDKVQRLINLLYNKQEPNNESVEDAWSDLANYGLIGQLFHAKDWD